ncbi:MAG: tetratricopeptide repeat protein [Treponema sp.]|nr:tetratricopeptide repeat protein [Treponema sp.]
MRVGARFFSVLVFLFCTGTFFSESAVSLCDRAIKKQNEGDYYSAVELYRESVLKNPQYALAWYNLSYCTYLLGEYELSLVYIDEALKFSSSLTEAKNLKGMILLCLGKVTEASAIFSDVLKTYPNNVDARFGLAQVDLLGGNLGAAENRYLDALKMDATNRKTLLSLALVSAESGNQEAAERYINMALEYHSGEAGVHYLASYLAARRGEYSIAERRARSAVQINSSFDRAYELLSEILYAQGRYKDTCDLCDFRIGRNRNLTSAWYLKGLSLSCLGETERAVAAWQTGLSIDPQDEIMRLGMEQLVKSGVPLEDKRRPSWASFHIKKAYEAKVNLDSEAERYEYQRALSLNPEDLETRRNFALLLERDNLHELYLHQLKFIKENSKENKKEEVQVQKNENTPVSKKSSFEMELEDTIEAIESLLEDNLSSSWGTDPFYLDKTRWKIGIYYLANPASVVHSDSAGIIAKAVRDVFEGVSVASVKLETEPVDSYSGAFSLARKNGTDYFLILSADETERSFLLEAQMYSTRTGTKTTDFNIYRTGNDKIAKSLRRLRSGVLSVLPIKGRVLQIKGNRVLVDLGKSDGAVKDAVFDVVRKGSIRTNDSGPGIFYPSETLIGTFKAEKVDEEISEGTFTKKGFYNVLNAADEVVLVSVPEGKEEAQNGANETRPMADADGEPATQESRLAEREAVKESLKEQRRESTLINMIRSVF